MCICVYVYMYMAIYVYIYISLYILAYIRVSLYMYIYICISAYIHVSTHICIFFSRCQHRRRRLAPKANASEQIIESYVANKREVCAKCVAVIIKFAFHAYAELEFLACCRMRKDLVPTGIFAMWCPICAERKICDCRMEL